MRYVQIFFLYFQEAFAERGRSFVWFLITLLNPLLYFTFWYAATGGGEQTIFGSSMQSISSYYFLLIVAGSMLQSHAEENIGYWHIYHGRLTNYLLRPISYYGINFLSEIPWRIIQGFFGIVVFFLMNFFFPHFIVLTSDIWTMILAFCIFFLAYTLSYAVKVVIGVSAFWLTDYHGLVEIVDMFRLIAGGFVVPLYLFPDWIFKIVSFTPFPYSMYFPILAWQGKLSYGELFQCIGIQLLWIVGFFAIFKILWKKGSREYTGVSQ